MNLRGILVRKFACAVEFLLRKGHGEGHAGTLLEDAILLQEPPGNPMSFPYDPL
jgi:hypothetical protein